MYHICKSIPDGERQYHLFLALSDGGVSYGIIAHVSLTSREIYPLAPIVPNPRVDLICTLAVECHFGRMGLAVLVPITLILWALSYGSRDACLHRVCKTAQCIGVKVQLSWLMLNVELIFHQLEVPSHEPRRRASFNRVLHAMQPLESRVVSDQGETLIP